jgi:pimeloyl-ACP methyl ester carboxylesterase
MILKSAPTKSLQDNILFESKQRMLRYRQNASAIAASSQTWRDLLGALCDNRDWAPAVRAYGLAQRASWFPYSLLPPNLHLPLQGPAAAGWRNFACYDPGRTLLSVRTPTLALYGSNDRAVDVPHASRTLRAGFAKAGMTDFTMRLFPGAAHTLVLSRDGFVPDVPARYVQGYPEIMIDWLARRGFLKANGS